MLTSPTERQLRAVLHIASGDPESYRALAEWIGTSLEETRRSNDRLDGIQLYRSQGAAQTLDVMDLAFKEAPERIRLMQARAAAEKTSTATGDNPAGA